MTADIDETTFARRSEIEAIIRSIRRDIARFDVFHERFALWEIVRPDGDPERVASSLEATFPPDEVEPMEPSDVARAKEVKDVIKRLRRAHERLRGEMAKAEALMMEQLPVLLDAGADHRARIQAAREVDRLMNMSCVRDRVMNELAARPLTPSQMVALVDAFDVAKGGTHPSYNLDLVVRWIEARQGAITEVFRAFESLPRAIFGEDEAAHARMRAALVRGGVFRALAILPEDHTSVALVAADLLTRPEIEDEPRCRVLVKALIEPFAVTEARTGVSPAHLRGAWASYGFLADETNHCNGAYDEDPSPVAASITRARLCEVGGRFEDALADYDELLNADATDGEARRGRAAVLRRCGRFEASLADYGVLLAAQPHDLAARLGWAKTLWQAGRFEEALAIYECILETAPGNGAAEHDRAAALAAAGRLEEALQAYGRLRAKAPTDEEPRRGRASVLAALGRWREALAELPVAAPDHWPACHARGMIFLRAKRLGAAEAVFNLGVDHPFDLERDRFRLAMAIVRIHGGEFHTVPALIASVGTPSLQSIADVLRCHAHLLSGNSAGSREAMGRIPRVGPPLLDEARVELSRRANGAPPPQDDRLLDVETELLVRALGQAG